VPDPYAVLGLVPGATEAEAEVAYRRLLFQWHPDRHAGEGPEAVARAEARTRELNDAMAAIRGGARSDRVADPAPSGGGRSGWGDDPDPVGRSREHAPVPCPFCGEPMTSLAGFEDHLARAHPQAAHARARSSRARGHQARNRSRRWWPVPVGAFVVVNLVVVVVVIAGVAGLGGNDAVIDRLHSTTPSAMSSLAAADPGRCPDGRYPRASWWAPNGTCRDRSWPLGYLVVGMVPSLGYWAYRRTTRG
jgi:hypothetical protein